MADLERAHEEWHKKYIETLINCGINRKVAEECLAGGMGEYDYNDDPEDAALYELSYWEGG